MNAYYDDIVKKYEHIKAAYENLNEHYAALEEAYEEFRKEQKRFIAQEVSLCVAMAVFIVINILVK